MHLYPPTDYLQYNSMYIYLIFTSVKYVIWKNKSITKSCILNSQKCLLEIPKVYMDMRDHTRWKIYILCHMQEILKRWEGASICRISWKINTWKTNNWYKKYNDKFKFVKKINLYHQKITNSMLKVPIVAYKARY